MGAWWWECREHRRCRMVGTWTSFLLLLAGWGCDRQCECECLCCLELDLALTWTSPELDLESVMSVGLCLLSPLRPGKHGYAHRHRRCGSELICQSVLYRCWLPFNDFGSGVSQVLKSFLALPSYGSCL